MAPKRPCRAPGCRIIDCQVHRAPEHGWSTNRREDVKRLTGRPNQARRAQLFQREPLCRACAAKGLVTLATIADHIAPLAESGKDDREVTLDELQPLCQACSDVKTRAEAMRARGRAR